MTESKPTYGAVLRDLDRVRAIVHNLSPDLDLDRARAVVLDLDRVRAIVRDLDRSVRARARAHDLARDLDFALSLDRDRDLARDLALHLSSTLEMAYRRAVELVGVVSASAPIEESVAPPEVVRVSRLAVRASGFAARLLPRADRDRYAEEYASELYELARISRRAQWAYAARQLVRSPLLRRELRRDTPGAVPGR